MQTEEPQHFFKTRIHNGDHALTIALSQANRRVVKEMPEYFVCWLGSPRDFSCSAHTFTLLGTVPKGNLQAWPYIPPFSQNGTGASYSLVQLPFRPNIERRACGCEGQMSLKREIFLWKTRMGRRKSASGFRGSFEWQ